MGLGLGCLWLAPTWHVALSAATSLFHSLRRSAAPSWLMVSMPTWEARVWAYSLQDTGSHMQRGETGSDKCVEKGQVVVCCWIDFEWLMSCPCCVV